LVAIRINVDNEVNIAVVVKSQNIDVTVINNVKA